MSTVNNKDRELSKILGYGMVEAPAELELLIKKRIAAEVVEPKRSNMGIVTGWFPVTVSLVGLIYGILTSISAFFPGFGSAHEAITKVLTFILSPTVMMIALSVIVLILLDSLLERRIGKTLVKLG